MNRYIRIGIFSLVAILILLFGVMYLKQEDMLFRGTKLYAVYEDLGGLTESSPVLYHGYKIGSITNFDIVKNDDAPAFVVTLSIEKPLDIPRDSKAMISSLDILGGKGVSIEMGQAGTLVESGDTIVGMVEKGMLDDIAPLKDGAGEMINSATMTLGSVNDVLNQENQKNIAKSLQNIERLTAQLALMTQKGSDVNGMLADLKKLTASLSSQNERIDSIMSGANNLISQIKNAHIDEVLMSVNKIVEGVEHGDGTVGNLLKDRELYDNLNKAVGSLDALLVDIKTNPSRYINVSVFGKKN